MSHIKRDQDELTYVEIPMLKSKVADALPKLLQYAARLMAESEAPRPSSQKPLEETKEKFRKVMSVSKEVTYVALGEQRICRWINNVCSCGTCAEKLSSFNRK